MNLAIQGLLTQTVNGRLMTDAERKQYSKGLSVDSNLGMEDRMKIFEDIGRSTSGDMMFEAQARTMAGNVAERMRKAGTLGKDDLLNSTQQEAIATAVSLQQIAKLKPEQMETSTIGGDKKKFLEDIQDYQKFYQQQIDANVLSVGDIEKAYMADRKKSPEDMKAMKKWWEDEAIANKAVGSVGGSDNTPMGQMVYYLKNIWESLLNIGSNNRLPAPAPRDPVPAPAGTPPK
jgi:hypothetical protein